LVFLFWIATRGKNMKRILLTTTSLVLAAGVAQADITFSGATGIALIDDNGASMAASVGDQRAALVAASRSAVNADTNADTAATAAAAANTTGVANAAAAGYAALSAANKALVDADEAAAAAAVVTNAALAPAAALVTAYDADPAGTNTAAATTARATRDGMFFESYYDFNVTASAESDNGISVSVGFDMGAGSMIDYNDDDVLEAQGNDVGDADVAVSYGGWTLKVDQNGIDNLFDDTQAGDMSLSGSLAGMSVAVTTDQEADTNSYKVSGTVGGIALTATGTDNDDAGGSASKIAASYAMGDLTLSASVKDESVNAHDDTTVGLSYAMDTLTVGYTSIKPGADGSFGDEWDFSVKYAAGAVAASFATDETDATTIILDYSLGGGASAFAAMHDKAGTDSDLTAIGLNFAF
jgi:hypothetical protein